jgi:hypothetical protein
MVDFKSLKKRSGDLEVLREQAKKLNTKQTFEADPRFWYPDVDEQGNSVSIIRFLPSPECDGDDGLPFVKQFRHSFQNPETSKWYIENCLTTIKQSDPVVDYCNKLYNTKQEHNIKFAGTMKRSASTIVNVYIISDKVHPENNGKVFLFRVGNQIWGKVEEGMNPAEGESRAPIIPFNMWEDGANFIIRIKSKLVVDPATGQKKKTRDYTSSGFDVPGTLGNFKDAQLEAIWKQAYSLAQFNDPEAKEHDGSPMYKSYDTLQTKFYKVLGLDTQDGNASDQTISKRAADVVEDGSDPETEEANRALAEKLISQKAKQKPKAAPVVEESEESLVDDSELDTTTDENTVAFLKKLAGNNK